VGAERGRPAQDLARLFTLAIALAVFLAGCGGGAGSTSAVDTSAQVPAPGGNGTLRYAVVAVPRDLDPLLASGREQKLISMQLHEPLVESVRPPYGRGQERPGLALSIEPSADGTIWTAQLRSNVRFQDGTRFNGAAVVANARRWSSTPTGRALLPALFTADSPSPDTVRFQLNRPDPGFAGRLAAPQLGIVAPQSLRPENGDGAHVSGTAAEGTGPFQIGDIDSGRVVLERFPAWWGSPLGLGPALDGIEFHSNADALSRLSELESGHVDVADDLPPTTMGRVAADPLLSALPGRARVGLSRAVRGLDSAGPFSYSGVWLTTIKGD
jgi:peptide/nickel transport system substrate-binding protein